MSSYTDFKVNLENKNSSWTLIYEQIDKGSKVLDIGCSSGYFDKILIDDKKCIVDGIELDANDAKKARKICRTVTEGNIEDDNFPLEKLDTKYDYILFIDVLEHLIDPAQALKKVARLLNSKGKIIFSIPNMANSAVRLQLLQGNFDYESEGLLDETHLHYYTAKTIDTMVQKSGLTCNYLTYTTFDPPVSMIHDVLNRVGLKSTKKFEDFLTEKDAVAYQYIGNLSLHGKKKVTLAKKVQDIKPRSEYETQILEVQQAAWTSRAELSKSQEEIIKLSAENQQLREQLQATPSLRKIIYKKITRKR